MPQPLASLSLDLDNKWSYLKTHGDSSWESLPSYLPIVVPRMLDVLAERRLTITFFIVGLDAAQPASAPWLRQLADAGHEIANHSYRHEPWLHLYSREQIEEELATAEEHIAQATGQRPLGFRGPGYSLSQATLEVLVRRGYEYDCSTFPTFLGPLARAYYFATARLSAEERRRRARLFGHWSEGLRPLAPYRWQLPERELVEIPVTTFPVVRSPIHLSYILYAAGYSPALALAYFRASLLACRAAGIRPSVLLHPLDFLGAEDDPDLGFFPAMRQPRATKLRVLGEALDLLSRQFRVVTMREHAASVAADPRTPRRKPHFPVPVPSDGKDDFPSAQLRDEPALSR